MSPFLDDTLSDLQLSALSSIVQVSEATYSDLMEAQRPMFGHPYFSEIRGRIRTKLVQMQCEIESHDSNFPFAFAQQRFSYNQCVPELHTKSMIIHFARSSAPDILPSPAKYKTLLSNNNSLLCQQLIISNENPGSEAYEPFYGILVFGGKRQQFTTIQFPAPGYSGIADHIDVPPINLKSKSEAAEAFERKKASLKKEFLARETQEVVS